MVTAIEQLQVQVARLEQGLAALAAFIQRDSIAREDRDRDILALALGRRVVIRYDLAITTEHPVARESDDHKFPHGTASDNTRQPSFVLACERIFGRKVKHLDLGCAGGGLVWDFLLAGHLSVGVEGSDYSILRQRAEWRTISSHLFTADVTKPFQITRAGTPLKFDIITAWELLEHIPSQLIDGVFDNVLSHLSEGGLFVASVATSPDCNPELGAIWHATVKPAEWWVSRLEAKGLFPCDVPLRHEEYARGVGNPRVPDWDSVETPELGFHLVVRKQSPRSGEEKPAASSGT